MASCGAGVERVKIDEQLGEFVIGRGAKCTHQVFLLFFKFAYSKAQVNVAYVTTPNEE